MTDRMPSRIADFLLTLWIAAVGVIYFGGYFLPEIGSLTGAGAGLYALMLLVSALVIARRFLRRSSEGKSQEADQRPPNDTAP